jgi:ribonuclease HI
MNKQQKSTRAIRIHCDGSGCRPDGKGSAIAWFREDTGEGHVEVLDGFTNNAAEYKAIISALEAVPHRSEVVILSDSQIAIYQLSGQWDVYDPDLADLRNLAESIIKENKLTVKFQWIPRGQNRADKLLRRKKVAPRNSTTKQGASA